MFVLSLLITRVSLRTAFCAEGTLEAILGSVCVNEVNRNDLEALLEPAPYWTAR